METLESDQIQDQLPEPWQFKDGALEAEFKFGDFKAAFAFMTKVADLAEAAQHHPDWSNVYNRVSIRLSTHEAGGVTQKDVDLAKQIAAVA